MTIPTTRETPTAKKPPLLSEAILIALGTAYAYAVASGYERAYASRFGIPFDVIDLRLATVLNAAASLLSVALYVAIVIDWMGHWIVREPKNHWARVGMNLLFYLSLFVAVTLGVVGLERWKVAVIAVAVVLLPNSLMQLSFAGLRRRAPKVLAPAIKRFGPDSLYLRGSALLRQRLGPMNYWLLFAAIITLAAAVGKGWVRAMDEEEFLLVGPKFEEAVLRIYGDKIVTARVDLASKIVYPDYRVIPLADSGLHLSKRHTGRLTLAPTPSP